MKPPQGVPTTPLPCQKRRSAYLKILHQAHSHLLRVPREAPREVCTGISVPRKSPLLRSQTPATGRKNAPPATNIAARTNLVRSPAWTSIA